MTGQAFDVVVLGTGPAGIQAAIHASRKKVSVALLGRETKSSLFHAHIENFCCVFNLTGEDMLKTGREQAESFGARLMDEDVMEVIQNGPIFELKTESGLSIATKAMVVATGTSRNKLRAPGEKELLGKGVSYCVECDGNFFKKERVAVVGGQSAAVGGALTMTEIADAVHLICDRLDVAAPLAQALENSPVVVHRGVKVKKIQGENQVESLLLDDGTQLPVTGVFIELGARGVMALATSLGIMLDDEMRYIRANKQQETNIPGIYAAGDVCGPPWQMAKAVGEGCVAGLNAATYAKKLNAG